MTRCSPRRRATGSRWRTTSWPPWPHGDQVLPGPQQLLALRRPVAPGVWALTSRPQTPLSQPALLTNARGEPSMGTELTAELDSADSVDLLCAFVKWSGLRLVEPTRSGASPSGAARSAS